MKTHRLLPLLVLPALLVFGASNPANAQNELGPDSKPQAGVPKGEVIKLTFEGSKIFPGTFRDYWVYVPAQYRPDKPACLYVNQDGIQWQAPTVFDNLIHKKEVPITIGVFVVHGRVRPKDGNTALDRFNRSFEYDGLGDKYARFIAEELIPAVERQKTADGRAIRVSKDPNDRAIGGGSSGAVCAFTAAWERPDLFRRVWSAIGTYVGLRGADRYPTLLRKYEPKPIRVFLQDGSNDQNIYAGDWWMANLMMERALVFAGNEVNHAWGEGGHNGQHGTAIFPDVMRWLWKDWPKPVQAGKSKNTMMNDILVAGQEWKATSNGVSGAYGVSVDGRGQAAFVDTNTGKVIHLSSSGEATGTPSDAKRADAVAFGPGGAYYSISTTGELSVSDAGGTSRRLTTGIRARTMVAAGNGNLYVSEPSLHGAQLWLVRPDGKKQVVDAVAPAGAITLSPDQTLLYAADASSHWIYSYQIQPDGTLDFKQQYYWLHLPDGKNRSDATSMCVDRDGRLYVATNLGIQVCDQAGRVNCIFPTPSEGASGVAIGGEHGDTLIAISAGKVYTRKLGIKGTQPWSAPNKPAAPRL